MQIHFPYVITVFEAKSCYFLIPNIFSTPDQPPTSKSINTSKLEIAKYKKYIELIKEIKNLMGKDDNQIARLLEEFKLKGSSPEIQQIEKALNIKVNQAYSHLLKLLNKSTATLIYERCKSCNHDVSVRLAKYKDTIKCMKCYMEHVTSNIKSFASNDLLLPLASLYRSQSFLEAPQIPLILSTSTEDNSNFDGEIKHLQTIEKPYQPPRTISKSGPPHATKNKVKPSVELIDINTRNVVIPNLTIRNPKSQQ